MDSRAPRKIASLILSAAMAIQPTVGGAAEYYFRHVGSAGQNGPSSTDDAGATDPTSPGGGLPPTAGQNGLPPSGELAITVPYQVRARPGIPFVLQVSASNPGGDVTWSSVGKALPAGLSIDPSSGAITGTPTTAADVSGLRIRGVDSSGKEGLSAEFIIAVRPMPSVTVATSASGATGSTLTVAPRVTNAFGTQAWSVSGPLPLGLELDSATGRISGVPAQQGTFGGLVLTVTDADGAVGRSQPITLKVTSRIAVSIPETVNARAGKQLAAVQPRASGTTGPYRFAMAGTALPVGLSLDANTGAITGIPASAGTTSGLALRVTDATTGDATVSPPFRIVAADVPTVTLGASYLVRSGTRLGISPTASNILGGAYWARSGRSWTQFNRDDGGMWGYGGTPGTDENLVLTVTDLFDGATAKSRPFSIRTIPMLSVGAPGVPAARVDTAFTMQPPVVNGLVGTGRWSVGALPEGLALNPDTGVVTGTPKAAGRTITNYSVTDSIDGLSRTGPAFSIEVVAPGVPVPFTVADLPEAVPGTIGRPFSLVPVASGNKGAVTWTLAGTLPGWAKFDPADGTIAGTPDAGGTTSGLVLTARDAGDGAIKPSRTFSIIVEAAPFVASYDTLTTTAYQNFTSSPPSIANQRGDVNYALASGTLPEGLSIVPNTGEVKGQAKVAGTAQGLVVLATDGSGQAAYTPPFDIVVNPAATSPSLAVAPAPAVVGEAYSLSPKVGNAVSPLRFTVAEGTLPGWARLDGNTGVISGTPTAAGVTDGLVVRLADVRGLVARSVPFSLAVTNAPALFASFPAENSAILGSALDLRPTLAAASGKTTWALVAGTLPPGLSLNPDTGAISGRPAAVGRTAGLALTVTDSRGAPFRTNDFSLSVGTNPLVLGDYPATLQAYASQSFSAPAPSVSGAAGSVTWTVASGSLPGWATLDPATGTISGTPDAMGSTTGLRLSATDAAGTGVVGSPFTLAVSRPVMKAVSTARFAVHAGTPFATPAPDLTGAVGAVTWALATPAPSGLTLDDKSGVISGALEEGGSVGNLALTAHDAFDGSATTSNALSIDVLGEPAVEVSGTYRGARGLAFSAAPVAANLAAGQVWELASGTLPAWATLDPATGAITGTPDAPGSYDGISLSVRDSQGGQATSAAFAVSITNGMLASTKKAVYSARIGVAFKGEAPSIQRQVGAVTWDVASGALPGWATLDPASGLITGTPDAPSTATFALRATDSTGESASTSDLVVKSTAAPAVSVASATLRAGVPLGVNPRATGAVGTTVWEVASGTLPDWIKLDRSSGALTGKAPGPTSVPGLSLRVTDADGAVGTSPAFTLTVTQGLQASALPDLSGRAGLAYAATLAAPIGLVGTASWAVTKGALPGGVRILANGNLSGTPSGPGTAMPTLTVTDSSDGATLDVNPTFVIAPPYAVSGDASVAVHVGQGFATRALAIVGQRGAATWDIASGTLPSWGRLESATGVVSGTAPGAPTSVTGLVLRATDARDGAAAKSPAFGISVLPPLGVADVPTRFTARYGFAFASAAPSTAFAIGPVTWAWGTTTPPAWASVNPSTGVISGKPDSLADVANLTLVARDAVGGTASSAPFTLGTYAQPAVTVPSSQVSARVGDAVSVAPTAVGVVGTPSWSLVTLSGAMPAGVALNPANGLVSGSPRAPGSASFAVRVADSLDGTIADSPTVSLTVSPAFSLSGMRANYYGRVGSFLTLDLPKVTGSVSTPVFSLTGTLPSGVDLVDTATGVIKGLPRGALSPRSITLSVTDPFDNRVAKTSFGVSVLPQPTIDGVRDVMLRSGSDAGPATFAPAADNVFTAANGTWSLATANLPSGVTFDTRTGKLSGVPAAYGAATAFPGNKLVLTDATDGAASEPAMFSVTVNGPLVVSLAKTAFSARGGTPLAVPAPTYSGLVGAPEWTATTVSGTPATVVAAADGSLTVTPAANATGTWTYRLTLKDKADGATVSSEPVSVSVIPATTVAYVANTPVAPNGTVNLVPSPKANLGALTYAIASGTLPNGVTLKADGTISGVPTVPGISNVTVSFTDTDGYVGTSNAIRIAVSNAPDVYLGSVPPAKVGRPFSVSATTNAVPATWGLTGTLPTGLTRANGTVSGSPTTAGASGSLALTVTDSKNVTGQSEAFVINVAAGNSVTLAQDASKWRQGLQATLRFAASANSVAPVKWSVSSGYLPQGVVLDPDTGVASGVPSNPGVYSATVKATDAEGSVATMPYSATVSTGPTLAYASQNLLPGVRSTFRGTATNLTGTPTYALVSGTLPDGLGLDPATGEIAGSPNAVTASPAYVTVRVADADGAGATSSFSVIVSNNGFAVDAGTTAFSATVGTPFSARPSAYLRNAAVNQYVTWSLTGKLPLGLGFDAATGTISGTPAAGTAGTVSLTLTGTYGGQTASTPTIPLTVAERPVPVATVDPATYSIRKGVAFSMKANVAQTVGAVSWTLASGTIPPGLALNDVTGVVSGKPTTNGSYAFTLRATDSSKQATTPQVGVTVQDGITPGIVVRSTAPRVGKAYLANLTVEGASGAATWTLASGSLPNGVTLDPQNGNLAGAPTANGTWTPTLRVTDATGANASLPVTITVGLGPSVNAVPALSTLVGKGFAYTPTQANAASPMTWSLTGTPPAGITLTDAATGAVGGAATVAGTASDLRLVVTDADGLTATSAPFSITVAPVSTQLSATMVAAVSLAQGQQATFGPVVSGTTATSQTYQLQAFSVSYGGAAGQCGYTYNACWNYASATPPTGMAFDTRTGVISGTPTATAVAAAYRILVTDNRPTPAAVITNQFTITVSPYVAPAVSLAAVYPVTRGQPFVAQPSVSGTTGTVSYQLQAYSVSNGGAAGQCGYTSNPCWNFASATLPTGLQFSTTTGAITGTVLLPTTSFPTTPYRVAISDARFSGIVSQTFNFAYSDWDQPSLGYPQTVILTRGQAVNLLPSVSGATGSLTYQLQAYSASYGGAAGQCGYTYNPCWNYASATLPAGLAFDTRTGGISGIPQTNASAIGAYRVALTELRSGQTLTATSNVITPVAQDWTLPSLSVDQSPTFVRGVYRTLVPAPSGTSGSLSYQLQAYGVSYGGAAGQCGYTYNACWNYASATLPAGLTFDAATGIIAGTLQNTTLPVPAYRLALTETRAAGNSNQTLPAISAAMAFTLQDWTQPTVYYAPRTDFVVGAPMDEIRPTLTGMTGTPSYQLQAWSSSYGGGVGQCGYTYNACWNPVNAPLPTGLSFSPTTGIISGKPTSLSAVSAYRVALTETRAAGNSNQSNPATSNQFTLVGAAAPATGPSLSYGGSPLQVTANVPFSFTPTLSGAAAVTGNYTITYGQSTSPNMAGEANANALPSAPNVKINAATGEISGTVAPGNAGTWRGYQVCAPTAAGKACANEVAIRVTERPNVVVGLPTYVTVNVNEPLEMRPDVRNQVGAVTYSLVAVASGAQQTNGELLGMPPGVAQPEASTGVIKGVPNTVGTYRGYAMVARDSQGATYQGQTGEIVIRVLDQPTFSLSAPPLVDVQQNVPVSPAIAATPTNAYGAVAWDAAPKFAQTTAVNGGNPDGMQTYILGSLPAGMAYNPDGTITGGPASTVAPGLYRGYQICGKDGLKRSKCTDEIVIRVAARPAFSVSAPAYVTLTQGDADVSIQATPVSPVGGVAWSSALLVGQTSAVASADTKDYVQTPLPSGLVYYPATGTIRGNLAANAVVGRYHGYAFAGSDSQTANVKGNEVKIEVRPAQPLAVSMPLMTDLSRGSATIAVRPTVTGLLAAAGALTYQLKVGQTTAVNGSNGDVVQTPLPGTLALQADGSLSGTVPVSTTVGRYRGYQVCATDSRGQACSAEFVLNVQ